MSTPPYDQLPTNIYSARPALDLSKCKYPETAKWGLGVWGIFPNLVMVFEAWHKLSLFDYYDLRIRDLNKPIASDIVQTLGNRYNLLVAGANVPEGVSKVLGHVVRAGSGQESRSDTEEWLFKTTLPGGYDRKVWEAWHSELLLSLEDALTGSALPEGSIIDASVEANGVVCVIQPYENIRQNDVITLVWGGIYFEHIVSPAEAAGSQPLRIPVPANVISQANQLGPLYIVFKVVDVVENPSGGKYEYSKPYLVSMELDLSLRDAPIHFVNGVESLQIDLDIESKAKFTLQASLKREKVKPNPPKQIVGFLDLTFPDGTTRTESLPAVADKNVTFETLPIPNDIVIALSGGSYRARFEVRSASGALLEKSASTVVRVVGRAQVMPAPKVSPMEGRMMRIDTDALLEVPIYTPHNKAWRETKVLQQGVPGGGGERLTLSQLAGEQGGTTYLDKADLKRFENKGIFSISYFTNDGLGKASSIRTSDELEAELGDRNNILPKAIVKVADGGNIDPDQVKGGQMLFWIPYFGTIIGDIVHWAFVGLDAEGSVNGSFTIDDATAGPKLLDLLLEIEKSVLIRSLGGAVSLSYSVERAGQSSYYESSEIADFNVGKGIKWGPLVVLEADKELQDQLYAKDVSNGAHVQITVNNMLDTDVFTPRWAGIHGISIEEARVRGDSLTNTATALISPKTVALGLREGGNTITITCSFIRGQVTYRSEPLRLRLMPPDDLPKATLNGVTDAILPLLSLGTNEVALAIEPWFLMQRNQRLWLDMNGVLATGKPFTKQLYNAYPVTADQVVHGINVLISTGELRQLQENSLLTIQPRVSFAQRDEKDTGIPFPSRDYRILAVPATLPPPAFDNKTGPLAISALLYLSGAIVVITYGGMTTAQIITLEWIFPDGTLAIIPAQNGTSSGRVDVAISPQIIAQSLGKTITLRYTIKSGTKTISSDVQVLTVGAIPVSSLPQALINNQVDGTTLYLANAPSQLTLSLQPWLLILSGQRVWITLRGKTALPFDVLTGYSINASEVKNGLKDIQIPKSWVETEANNGEAVVYVYVAFDGSANKINALPLRNTTYTVKNYDLETFINTPEQIVSTLNTPIVGDFVSVKLTQKQNINAHIDIRKSLAEHYFKSSGIDKAFFAYTYAERSSVRYEIAVTNRTSRRVTFQLTGGNITFVNPSLTIAFLNAAGATLSQQNLNQPNTYYYNREIIIDSGYTDGIKTVVISTNSQFIIGNLKIY